MRPPSLPVAASSFFPSHVGHPSCSCCALRLPIRFADHRRSSIAVSRVYMRHRHPRSCGTSGCSISQPVVPRPSRTLPYLIKAFEQEPWSGSLTSSYSSPYSYINMHNLVSVALQFRLQLNSIREDSFWGRAEGLMAHNPAVLDSRTLASLRQPLFHHRSADRGVCCSIGRGHLATADSRGEAKA